MSDDPELLMDDSPVEPDATSPRDSFPVDSDQGPLRKLVDYNFLQYASYVICDRAIPNVADGLKPVQRRIMHALHEKDDGRFIKVANVVGHTMQYHPHGDASINEALVSLANRGGYLIEGQGNFGNLYTGDRAAAGRYIECRLTPLARQELFNKELTHYSASYDGRNQEPMSLPSKLPLLLMLGADGIAVGLSTAILTYNFIELLEEQIEILREKKRTPHVANPLPDFQTGGVMDVSDYCGGVGKVKVRAKIEHRRGRLVITELPFGQTTEKLTASIEDAVKKKKVAVRAINDYTAEKVEIELTLSPGAPPEKVEKALYAFTQCEVSAASRIVVICANRPVEMSVDQILHLNTRQLVQVLEDELVLRRTKLSGELYLKTLIRLFIQHRIYKKLESCASAEAIYEAVIGGLNALDEPLARPITEADVTMLLGIPIKRISLFDLEKNRAELDRISAEIAEVEKNLKRINGYAIRYVKQLIKTYRAAYPRRTAIATFKEIALRELTATELTIGHDRATQFAGSSVKGGEPLLKCSSLDKLLFVWNDGRYQMVAPPEKMFVDGHLLSCSLFDRAREMTCVYTFKRIAYIKRFKWGGTVMNRDYRLAPEGAKIVLLLDGCPESIYVRYRPAKGQRIHQQEFHPQDLLLRGARAKGNRLTTKSIQYIDIKPGRWWRNDAAELSGDQPS